MKGLHYWPFVQESNYVFPSQSANNSEGNPLVDPTHAFGLSGSYTAMHGTNNRLSLIINMLNFTCTQKVVNESLRAYLSQDIPSWVIKF